ncbi:MAG TPA: DUF3035 domain-containing protein [Stellaceae bacterium]|nr:DUF3035 domain-containing protein [Stellaceae bacterium]
MSGCSNFKQIIGIDQPAPDEFAVESNAPLTIPPDFNLRPPEPGAPRPHQVTAAEKAQEIINAAGPGKPGDQAQAALLPQMVGAQIDPSRALHPDSLAARLLSAADSSAGTTLVGRKTTVLPGVY